MSNHLTPTDEIEEFGWFVVSRFDTFEDKLEELRRKIDMTLFKILEETNKEERASVESISGCILDYVKDNIHDSPLTDEYIGCIVEKVSEFTKNITDEGLAGIILYMKGFNNAGLKPESLYVGNHQVVAT